MIVEAVPKIEYTETSFKTGNNFQLSQLKVSIAKELANKLPRCNSLLDKMSITPSITSGVFTSASDQVLQAGLESMRKKSDELFLRCIALEASNKRLKENLRKLAEVDERVSKMAILALECEP